MDFSRNRRSGPLARAPLFAKDVALDQVGQTINVASFDIGFDGRITVVEPPLTPITDAYRREKR